MFILLKQLQQPASNYDKRNYYFSSFLVPIVNTFGFTVNI